MPHHDMGLLPIFHQSVFEPAQFIFYQLGLLRLVDHHIDPYENLQDSLDKRDDVLILLDLLYLEVEDLLENTNLCYPNDIVQ